VPRFRELSREMQARDDFIARPKNEREALRLQLLNGAWLNALKGSPYYGELARRLKLPDHFGSFEEYSSLVPATPKSALRMAADGFKLCGWRRGKWMATGGSTGVPVRVFWGLRGHLQSLRDQYWARSWWGIEPFDRQAMLWGHERSHGSGLAGNVRRIAVPLVDKLRRRIRFTAYKLDAESLRRYYDVIAGFGPKSLYAYASAAHLLALANRGREPLPRPLQAAFLAAEPVIDAFRESIREVFGCPCAGEYGSIDCGMIAYEHPRGGYRIFERSVYVETVPRGEGFEILVTQLRDTGFPLFRYEVGDMTSAPLMRGANGWEMLANVEGRSYDMLHGPGGAVVYGGAVTQIIKQLPDVAIFAVRQKRDFSISIEIQTCSGNDLAEAEKARIAREVGEILGPVPVEIRRVESLERTAAGKHRWITSELNTPQGAREK